MCLFNTFYKSFIPCTVYYPPFSWIPLRCACIEFTIDETSSYIELYDEPSPSLLFSISRPFAVIDIASTQSENSAYLSVISDNAKWRSVFISSKDLIRSFSAMNISLKPPSAYSIAAPYCTSKASLWIIADYKLSLRTEPNYLKFPWLRSLERYSIRAKVSMNLERSVLTRSL